MRPMSEAQTEEVRSECDVREAVLNRMAAEHYALMYRVAYRILRRPQEAEEALHNAWLNLCRARQLPDMRDERNYLSQSVRREAIALWKKYRRFPEADAGAEFALPDARSSPEQAASGAQVQRRLEMLPEKERAVVTLWYREGLSLVEIADVLQVPQGTVRRRFMQAKALLRPMFETKQSAGVRLTAAGEGSAR